ncbi:MAG: FG-GAP repeat domain-containing protein [Planctomycetota bacterium]|jgi:hypothetical protein
MPIPFNISGNITVRYSLVDDTNRQSASVSFEYTPDGLNWFPATEAPGTLAVPVITGDENSQLADWVFSGIRLGFNLENENMLYIDLSDSAGNRSLTLYLDEAETVEAASGWLTGNGTLLFSGTQITGTVGLKYVADDSDIALKLSVSEGTKLIPVSKLGAEHVFVWDSLRDIGMITQDGVMLRVTANDGDVSETVFSLPFTVNNAVSTPPSVSDIKLYGKGGNIVVSYLLTDPESNPSNVNVKYSLDNVNYIDATKAGLAGGDGKSFLRTEPAGVRHYFVWDSFTDIGEVREESVSIRISPADGGSAGSDCTSGIYLVENRVGEFLDETLTRMPPFLGGSYKCAAEDFDNDGDIDIFVANNGENMLYLNNGSACFSLERLYVRQSTSDAVVGDFNGDGLPDVFCCNKEENVLYFNGPAGTLTAIAVGPPAPTLTGVTADVQGDGVLDIITANYAVVAVQLGYGDGGFWPQLLPGTAYGLAKADFDNDGNEDIFIAAEGKNGGYLHDGAFNWFSFAPQLPEIYDISFAAAAEDFDNDGDADVFVANKGINVYLENRGGNGLFPGWFAYQPYTPLTAFLSADVVTLDFDCDGDLDLYIANDLATNELLMNVDGRFFDVSPVNIVEFGMRSYGACVADFNGDGQMDIFVANNGQNQFYLGISK